VFERLLPALVAGLCLLSTADPARGLTITETSDYAALPGATAIGGLGAGTHQITGTLAFACERRNGCSTVNQIAAGADLSDALSFSVAPMTTLLSARITLDIAADALSDDEVELVLDYGSGVASSRILDFGGGGAGLTATLLAPRPTQTVPALGLSYLIGPGNPRYGRDDSVSVAWSVDVEVGSMPAVPLPASALVLASGLAAALGGAALRRRRR
jgi:hypothetical protein